MISNNGYTGSLEKIANQGNPEKLYLGIETFKVGWLAYAIKAALRLAYLFKAFSS